MIPSCAQPLIEFKSRGFEGTYLLLGGIFPYAPVRGDFKGVKRNWAVHMTDQDSFCSVGGSENSREEIGC